MILQIKVENIYINLYAEGHKLGIQASVTLLDFAKL